MAFVDPFWAIHHLQRFFKQIRVNICMPINTSFQIWHLLFEIRVLQFFDQMNTLNKYDLQNILRYKIEFCLNQFGLHV